MVPAAPEDLLHPEGLGYQLAREDLPALPRPEDLGYPEGETNRPSLTVRLFVCRSVLVIPERPVTNLSHLGSRDSVHKVDV